MADTDAEAQLLDGIVGKYGDVAEYDIGNADEDALLDGFDEQEFATAKHSTGYLDETEELDHEPEEPDSEDVLDLEAQDVLDDFEVDKSSQHVSAHIPTVSSTTQPEADLSLNNRIVMEEKERCTDKFKNERLALTTKSSDIPDSLDEVPVQRSFNTGGNNKHNWHGPQQGRGRGRGSNNQRFNNYMPRSRPDNNKIVLINPHFKGQVEINDESRLAWDARQRINHNKNQIGRVAPFAQSNRKSGNSASNVQPWVNVPQNIPQYQPPPTPVYQPIFQQPQMPSWNQNSYNQPPLHQQISIPNQQMYNLQPHSLIPNNPPPQFNQAVQQFNPASVFPNMNFQPPMFNPSFVPPAYNQSMEINYPRFIQNQPPPTPNVFLPPPQQQQQQHQQHNQINTQYNNFSNNRIVSNPNNNNNFLVAQNQFERQRNNFPQTKMQFSNKISPKRKMDNNPDAWRRKRNVASSNLHEVATVETPDTTVQEEEDDELKAYRKKIEEQKQRREMMLQEKELKRQQDVQKWKQSVVALPSTSGANLPQQKRKQIGPRIQRNLQTVQINRPIQPAKAQTGSNLRILTAATTSQVGNNLNEKRIFSQPNSNIKVISTDNDDSNYDKQHLASFLSNRKILAKDQSLIDTSIVVVSNLAAGTTDVKLRKMCQGIGEIKKLQMSPKERQATIQFNSVASAHAFFKKYQRTMLDLSMIQVILKPVS